MSYAQPRSACLLGVLLGVFSCGERARPSIPSRIAERSGDSETRPPDPLPTLVQAEEESPAKTDETGPNCWADQLPPQTQPIRPAMTVADACKAATVGPWSYPNAVVHGDDDARAPLVGRWATCGKKGAFSTLSHAGIEFGANGRWRLLKKDSGDALVPMGPLVARAMGHYYALASGQLNLVSEGGGEGRIAFVKFKAEMQALRYDGGSMPGAPTGDYGRAEPSPLNGSDNPPSVSDGKCSMVGTWDVPANKAIPTAPPASIAFDGEGNFVGGPLGSNLCTAHTMYGTYRLSPGLFQLTSNVGMGRCSWWYDAGYAARFDASCSRVELVRDTDGCTGGRGYLNEPATLTRRQ